MTAESHSGCTCCRLPSGWSVDLVLRDDLGIRRTEHRSAGCLRAALSDVEAEAQRLAAEIAARWRKDRRALFHS